MCPCKYCHSSQFEKEISMLQSQQASNRRSSRPNLELLEDRLTPSAYQLINSYPVSMPTNGFLASNYQNILGHEPDAVGLGYWGAQLNGGASRADVATGIWNSPEHRNLEVETFYTRLLGRAAEPGALSYFVAQFQAGASEHQIMTNLVLSSEFTNGDSSPTTFVNNLYTKVLGRTADANAANWINALQTGTSRLAVAESFILSNEALTNAVDTYYQNFLQRAPSDADAQTWVTSMLNSQNAYESAALSILTSPEYAALSGSTPQAPMPPIYSVHGK
jgi:Domain of unknown function (DUF4214)